MSQHPWTGGFVRDALGVSIKTDHSASLLPVEDLVGLALRRNPKRAHLLVSRVLGKHVPSEPGLVMAAGELLGVLVGEALSASPESGSVTRTIAAGLAALLRGETHDDGRRAALRSLRRRLAGLKTRNQQIITIGYAETATGLGRLVADTIGSYYIHSSRHAPAGAAAYGSFEESHSHATSHRLLPTDPRRLNAPEPVVLVDDELSTGATIINTITELHALAPHPSYTVAALVDLRTPGDRARLDELAERLGTRIRVVALGTGQITLGADILQRADEVVAALPQVPATPDSAPGTVTFLKVAADGAAVRSDRFGNGGPPAAATLAEIGASIHRVLPQAAAAESVLVLGSEEFIHVPLAVADALDRLNPDRGVRFSTTTRSPILALDRPDYAITGTVQFTSHDVTVDGPGARFAHNVSSVGRRFGTIVLMPEPGTPAEVLSGAGSVTEALSAVCSAVVVVLLHASPILPAPLAGPAFGSYAPEEVTWLLKDIGDAALEAPAADREAAMQSGGASYAESLPIEYSPSQQYQQLYRDALKRSSARVAQAVGTVTEMALAARRNRPVLVSLARAGTPVGILMRRWAQQIHGIDLPHYTMSIVRGVGLDQTALRYLAAHHDPEQILFVDGWTGKGAVTRELSAALDRFADSDGIAFPKDLAVLADPGHCADMYGTREDYLIPSACLNSTVSGLVSRTVFNTKFIGPDDFHGAKYYHQLRGDDVSREFLAAVSGHFATVEASARAEAPALLAADRTPTWAGRLAVENLGREHGIDDLNLVKPGVGETTRVLLRRVPWKILMRPDAAPEIAHILLLAQQRGVTVLEVPDLPFSCVGLIDPRFSRRASGADGFTAAAAL
ncbi:pyrimidine operon attenuation protein/uracil phosphoribosyltransferase [Arthrobacter sp. V4I6]|uniref:phosphoribosyltransferase domain-containing protein n=1 Tax=unclassified Arthrobacter TaxID=235627 RepID=UPI00278A32DD|nr:MULTISPECIES: phosphoribosyltransferase domain-containing protein [unclassified Arthrobacter]MDQ0819464.1 pyrimidine operon attenuation protein/uracil phosphoribosyltransferase [Arthrobacter sp. V1I7]MDQ0853646.1 pyrimidine operon attenuation protein/uracil phosphoribosyltransferase [Arthrobacter sp. V4I6]